MRAQSPKWQGKTTRRGNLRAACSRILIRLTATREMGEREEEAEKKSRASCAPEKVRDKAHPRIMVRSLHGSDTRALSETSHAHARAARRTMPRAALRRTTCIPGDRLCSAFREQIGERRAGTRARRRGGPKGCGQHQPTRWTSTRGRRRRRRRRQRRRRNRGGLRHCSVPSPRALRSFFFHSPVHFIPVHHAVPSLPS